jgi:hypothetical protein
LSWFESRSGNKKPAALAAGFVFQAAARICSGERTGKLNQDQVKFWGIHGSRYGRLQYVFLLKDEFQIACKKATLTNIYFELLFVIQLLLIKT